MAGRLVRIWVKRGKRAPMGTCDSATLVEGQGILGNADQGGRRQVTILSWDQWKEVWAEIGQEVDPVARRANLLVEGIALPESRGRILLLGPCRLRVLGETRPCERMEEACAGLRSVLSPDWRGGVYCEVLQGGRISLEDDVRWETGSAEKEV